MTMMSLSAAAAVVTPSLSLPEPGLPMYVPTIVLYASEPSTASITWPAVAADTLTLFPAPIAPSAVTFTIPPVAALTFVSDAAAASTATANLLVLAPVAAVVKSSVATTSPITSPFAMATADLLTWLILASWYQ